MIGIWSTVRAGGEARALRFLVLCLCGWVALRTVAAWNPALPPTPDAARAPWVPPSPFAVAMTDASPMRPLLAEKARSFVHGDRPGREQAVPRASFQPGSRAEMGGGRPAGAGFGTDRHNLRLALMTRLLPPATAAGAVPSGAVSWFGPSPATKAQPGRGAPNWIQRSADDWSLGGWLYLRQGSGSAPSGIVAGSQLGGSQAGLRLTHGLGAGGRMRAYGRATVALAALKQRELAFGVTYAPVAGIPVDVAVEQRVAAGSQGRTALAAMAVGGVSDVRLPGGFRLDAYAQAGIVGARRRDGFADGAVVVDHRLGPDEQAPLRLGALAAGAVQPGAARVDVGPRLTLRLPDMGKGGRIALDWRQRVAGDARPESGLALTLGADF